MKSITVVVGLVILCFALGAQEITIGTTESSKTMVPLVEKVLKEAGFTPKFEVLPQARMISQLADSSIAGAFFVNDQMIQSAPGSVKVPVPLYKNDLVAVTLDPAVKIKNPADLKAYTIGVERGNPLQASVTKGLATTPVDNIQTQFRMLVSQRFQVLLCARALVPGMVKANKITNYYVQEPAIFTALLYFGLSPANANLEAKLTPFFQKRVDSGLWAKDIAAALAALSQ